jgi:Domain of unknown function (DUF4386)
MTSPKPLARIAGLLYLLVAIFSGFAFGYVLTKVYVAGDAATTAANVVANAGLVRMGVVADLFQATVWVFLAMTLYILLKHVHLSAARAMVTLVAVGAAIVCLNDVFQFESVRVATDGSYTAALGAAGSSALVLLLLEIHHYGFLVAQIFFGLWLVPLGYLASDVPQGAGRRAHRGGRLLPRGPARGVPGPRLRLRRKDQRLRHHPVSSRGDLDGPIPARDRREDPKAKSRRAHSGRGMNATARRVGPGTFPAPCPSADPGGTGHDPIAEHDASDTIRRRWARCLIG